MAQMVADAIRQATTNFLETAQQMLPRAMSTLGILLVGWLVAITVKWLMRWLLGRLRFNRGCERLGVTPVLAAAELPNPDVLVSLVAFWIVWIGFVLSGIEVLGFTALEGMLHSFTLFVPRLLTGVVILVAGVVCANFAWRATLLAAVNARVPSPRVVSGAVRALVLILAGAMALDQIAVARTIVLTAFAIAFGAVMLGLAIAFGVGGGDTARRILHHWFPESSRPEGDDLRHL